MVSFVKILYGAMLYLVIGEEQPEALLQTRTPKNYIVDLDLPEEHRWTEVARDHTEIVNVFHFIIRSVFPKIVIPAIEKIGEDIEKYIPAPFAREMKGISKILNTSVGNIVIINILYDITAFCTSIVSQDSKGQIWHSRNLDYSFTDMLKNLTISVDFKKNGKTVYSAITFAGYIGVMTGQKPNSFSVTVDQRNEGFVLWNLIIGLLDSAVVPVSFLVRDVLARKSNYSEAVDTLAHTDTAAPAYFIVAGLKPGEASVITKGRLKSDDIWTLDISTDRWFEVETNYDHWKPPGDKRRHTANAAMKSLGRQKISVPSLFKVMSTVPVLNRDTIYTTVMSAAQPELMQTWVRETPAS